MATVSPPAALSSSLVRSLMRPQCYTIRAGSLHKKRLFFQGGACGPATQNRAVGTASRQGPKRRIKKTQKGMIVFPGELRMYHQRHLTWRKTLRKGTKPEKQIVNQPFAVGD